LARAETIGRETRRVTLGCAILVELSPFEFVAHSLDYTYCCLLACGRRRSIMKPGPYGPFPYSPIIRRPHLEWPDGAHIALWVVPNIEFFSLETRPGGLAPGKIPDIPIWAMRDYGNRVGVFRLMEVLDRYGVRATFALNSDICVHHPEIIEEGEKRGWEWMGHNQSNSRRLNEVPAEEEPQIIRDTLDTIARASGRRPVGWLGAGLQETWNTLDLLTDAGCEYVAD